MPLIDQVNQMRQQGMNEGQISQKLAEQGISPLEINQSLEQSQIKTAVSDGQETPAPSHGQPPAPGMAQTISQPMTSEMGGNTDGMQPSIGTIEAAPGAGPAMQLPGQPERPQLPAQEPPAQAPDMAQAAQPQFNPAQTQEMPVSQQEMPVSQQEMPVSQQEMQPSAGPTTQGEYAYPEAQTPEYSEYQSYAAPGADTMTDIAEQIVEEKLSAIKSDVESAEKFKTELQTQTDNIEKRLKRIESIIEKLQSAILGKIGEYSENIDDIKTEMSMMQDTFSKALNPLIDKSRSADTKPKPKKRTPKQQDDGFEHYLRR